MKKQILFVCGVVFLLGVIYFTTGTGYSSAGTPDTKNYAETEGGGGGATAYTVEKSICLNDLKKTEYRCKVGGSYLCTVQNCP